MYTHHISLYDLEYELGQIHIFRNSQSQNLNTKGIKRIFFFDVYPVASVSMVTMVIQSTGLHASVTGYFKIPIFARSKLLGF